VDVIEVRLADANNEYFQNKSWRKFGLSFADHRLPMVAGDVVEPDSIIVEVVEDSQATLIPLPVVRLGSVVSSSVRPVNIVVALSTRPPDVAPSDIAASPEILLSLPSHQSQELSLLGVAVNGDCPHAIGSAEARRPPLGEGSAAETPGDQEILTSEVVVGLVSSSTATTSTTTSAVAKEHLSIILRPRSLWSWSRSHHIEEAIEKAKLWAG